MLHVRSRIRNRDMFQKLLFFLFSAHFEAPKQLFFPKKKQKCNIKHEDYVIETCVSFFEEKRFRNVTVSRKQRKKQVFEENVTCKISISKSRHFSKSCFLTVFCPLERTKKVFFQKRKPGNLHVSCDDLEIRGVTIIRKDNLSVNPY